MKILWGRILIAAFVLEVLYGLLLYAVLGGPEVAFMALGIGVVFVFMLLGGLWVARKAVWKPVLQGALVGIAAVIIYSVLTTPAMIAGELAVTGPLLLNHLAKIAGGTVGGLLAATVLAPGKRPQPSL